MTAEIEIARYVSDLRYCLENTRRAEDRKTYEAYLRDAGYILALVVLKAESELMFKEVASYEHLLGWSWLIDPVKGRYPDSYEKFKLEIGYKTKTGI